MGIGRGELASRPHYKNLLSPRPDAKMGNLRGLNELAQSFLPTETLPQLGSASCLTTLF